MSPVSHHSPIPLAYKSSSGNNTVINNNCSGNSYGIYLYHYATSNNITNNNIYQNTAYGIYIAQNSTGNTVHHNYFYQNNGAGKGVSGNCQAYDDAGGNYWYDNTAHEGNYWSNWDGQGWGTPNAYPIAGGTASDWYPLSSPVSEFSPLAVLILCVPAAFLGYLQRLQRRKSMR
jgi:parallel beta-helix repeat protein